MMPQPHWAGRIPEPTGGPMTLTDLQDVTGQPAPNLSPVYNDAGIAPLTAVTTQDDLDNVLAQVAAVDWHNIGDPGEPQFVNDFTNFGEGFAPCRWRLTLNNVVHLEGFVYRDQPLRDVPTSFFQLPAECSPGYRLAFLQAQGDSAICRVDIDEQGNVIWMGEYAGQELANAHVSLCGINYSVGESTVQPVPRP